MMRFLSPTDVIGFYDGAPVDQLADNIDMPAHDSPV